MRALLAGSGKMGHAIAAALASRGHEVVGWLGRDGLGKVHPEGIDVAFEFTAPEAAPALVKALLELGIPVVSGTTGWDVEPARLLAAGLRAPFLHAPNFSIGVAAMKRAVAALAGALAPFPEFEPGLVERHHAAKKDAPSGTAKALAAALEAARPGRPAVPVVSLRQGGQPGEHTVVFEGPDEAIEIVHRARSRAIFALGAVRAAEWLLASGPKGPASFDDTLTTQSRRTP